MSEAAKRQLQANGFADDGDLRPTPPSDNSEAECAGARSVLDGDGYVADEQLSRKPTLDGDGYVADEQLSTNPTLDGDGYVADEQLSRKPILDVDGYVADERLSRKPTLDVDGYVADERFGKRPALDADGYIAEENETWKPTPRLNAAGEADATLPRAAVVALSTGGVLVDSKAAAVHDVKSRSGIAPRRDRKPSVYDGFGNDDGGGNVSQNNSPLPLPQTAVVATAFQPPATRGPSENSRRADVKLSVNLGADQSVRRMSLPDETRL
jgi:hypothetical protein